MIVCQIDWLINSNILLCCCNCWVRSIRKLLYFAIRVIANHQVDQDRDCGSQSRLEAILAGK